MMQFEAVKSSISRKIFDICAALGLATSAGAGAGARGALTQPARNTTAALNSLTPVYPRPASASPHAATAHSIALYFSSNLRAQMLVISGNVPILLATPARNYGYVFIDLANGEISQTRPTEWASFNRWSLIMEDGDDEVELVSFGASTAT